MPSLLSLLARLWLRAFRRRSRWTNWDASIVAWLGRQGDPSSIPILVSLLDEPLGGSAREALAKIDGAKVFAFALNAWSEREWSKEALQNLAVVFRRTLSCGNDASLAVVREFATSLVSLGGRAAASGYDLAKELLWKEFDLQFALKILCRPNDRHEVEEGRDEVLRIVKDRLQEGLISSMSSDVAEQIAQCIDYRHDEKAMWTRALVAWGPPMRQRNGSPEAQFHLAATSGDVQGIMTGGVATLFRLARLGPEYALARSSGVLQRALQDGPEGNIQRWTKVLVGVGVPEVSVPTVLEAHLGVLLDDVRLGVEPEAPLATLAEILSARSTAALLPTSLLRRLEELSDPVKVEFYDDDEWVLVLDDRYRRPVTKERRVRLDASGVRTLASRELGRRGEIVAGTPNDERG